VIDDQEFERYFRSIAHAFEISPEGARSLYAYLIPFLRDCTRVLDLGCGRGILLGLLREHGISGEGVDVDPACVQECRAKGLTVHLGRIEDLIASDILGPRFDGLVMSHIIEHLAPLEAARLLFLAAHRVFDPQRAHRIVIITPRFETPPVGLHNFWLDATHIRPYPELLIVRMLEGLGFRPLPEGTRRWPRPDVAPLDTLVFAVRSPSGA
jgi:SAM-dependent methyltransferase